MRTPQSLVTKHMVLFPVSQRHREARTEHAGNIKLQMDWNGLRKQTVLLLKIGLNNRSCNVNYRQITYLVLVIVNSYLYGQTNAFESKGPNTTGLEQI